MYLLSKARKKGMPFFATPYYLSLLDVTGGGYDLSLIHISLQPICRACHIM